jgi:hypothetical protein
MKRPKRCIHEWYTATLSGSRLVPARGCLRKVVTLGETITETATNENHRQLMVNVGDRLMLFGASVDQIQIAEVTAIRVDGWRAELLLSLGVGGVNDGAVHVHKLAKKEAA